MTDLASTIDRAWENRTELSPDTRGEYRNAVEVAITGLDTGEFRVAARDDNGSWIVHQWLKKAVLLGFRLHPNRIMTDGPNGGNWWDKVPSKFENWDEGDFSAAGFRAVPGCGVRRGAYIAPDAVLMPSYVNIGAYVDRGTMVDTWTTVGSCAQIGKNCHLSGGVGIGGVLEPLQANPVIIEDNVFIGARSEVAEGVIVREGAVLAMGVFLSQGTKIYNRITGQMTYGEIPPYSVVVPGSLPAIGTPSGTSAVTPESPKISDYTHSLACAIIVKQVDAKTRSKTSVNELLRA
ncbi:MAG: 2,3,4,5-tetrahydropyridine-2,6-dicarboxylate N-succinyltransferase [Hyphomonadaceae bacterium]|nr:2,3,4,5-tetrahydropyridine-2,6-dicarboxylate N-succinyltransferase [Hyphomonadaceae bacterium]MBC6411517.1 2,3,4,5-tetrahydropyridine-2,6-dicarboxylate N-succinyltransferase [Hyphomonadaceae bacterium]